MICCLVPFWLVQRYCMSFQTDRVPPRKVEPHFTLGVFYSRSSNLPWFHMFPHLQTSFQRDAKCSVMMFFSGWHCHLASLGLEPTKKKATKSIHKWLWMTHRNTLPRHPPNGGRGFSWWCHHRDTSSTGERPGTTTTCPRTASTEVRHNLKRQKMWKLISQPWKKPRDV